MFTKLISKLLSSSKLMNDVDYNSNHYQNNYPSLDGNTKLQTRNLLVNYGTIQSIDYYKIQNQSFVLKLNK